MPKLLLIRGVPGTGKSTLAKTIKDEDGAPYFHVESDMYFTLPDGTYYYNRTKSRDAHTWCQEEAAQALERGWNVVVSNTFCQEWELDPYVEMANNLEVPYEVISLTKEYGNIHNIPADVMTRFRNRWQNDVEL